MWLIIHAFHAISKASLNRGLRDGKRQWCGYGSTYPLQQCSILLVWTHRTGKIGQTWLACILNGVWPIMHIFHATRQASLNKGLRDGKWEWCIYGSTYSLQQCSISLVWTQSSRKIRSDMTCMHIQWDMTHNVCFSCNKQGYLYQGGLWWKTTVMCIWQHLFAATVFHMIDIDIPGQENQVCHDLNAYSMRCDS